MSTGTPGFEEGEGLDLIPETGLRGQYGPYIADPALVHAANTALGLEMPLLLTGEPGSGKSDFAWVAARALGLPEPLRCHVRSDTRARDLLYHYDALVRFGDAQHGDREAARDPRRYVLLRPLGAALMTRERRSVVLIDEIDKAPRDLPNDLLHELDEGRFEIPEIGDYAGEEPVRDRVYSDVVLRRFMERPPDVKKPLVLITSNAERQLPEPFLRRCLFFHIPPASIGLLGEIAKKRFNDQDPRLMEDLARIFHALRREDFVKPPTTAEMLNWMQAVTRLYKRSDVRALIEAFAAKVREGGGKLEPGAELSWAHLPGLVCLLKLNEDLDAVGARAS
jgi:MoxR-like ATPase